MRTIQECRRITLEEGPRRTQEVQAQAVEGSDDSRQGGKGMENQRGDELEQSPSDFRECELYCM